MVLIDCGCEDGSHRSSLVLSPKADTVGCGAEKLVWSKLTARLCSFCSGSMATTVSASEEISWRKESYSAGTLKKAGDRVLLTAGIHLSTVSRSSLAEFTRPCPCRLTKFLLATGNSQTEVIKKGQAQVRNLDHGKQEC